MEELHRKMVCIYTHAFSPHPSKSRLCANIVGIVENSQKAGTTPKHYKKHMLLQMSKRLCQREGLL